MAQIHKTNHRQNTIEADTAGVGGSGIAGTKGTRNQASLNAIFQGSPLYSAAKYPIPGENDIDYSSPKELRNWFITNVVKGTVTDASYGLGTYDREFGNNAVDGNPSPPDLASNALAVEGPKPASGFVPNPTSPGEGSVKAETKPDAPEDFVKSLTPNGSAFAGDNITDKAKLIDQAKSIVARIETEA